MIVTLNKPSYPYRTNRYYRHLLERLTDKNIYDVSEVAVGKKEPFRAPVINNVAAAMVPNAILSPGTYYYTVVGITTYGETLPAKELSVVITAPMNAAVIQWSVVPYATTYRIFRSDTSNDYGNKYLGSVTGSTFTDTGYVEQLGYPLASSIRLTGTVTPVGIYEVDLMARGAGDEAFSSMAKTTTKADGTFEFEVQLPRGENVLYALVSSDYSASVYVNAYNLHLYFEAIANELYYQWQERMEQVRADFYIEPVKNIFDNEYRYPSDDALRDLWGLMTDAFRSQNFTSDEYRLLIKDILYSYRRATTYEAIKNIFEKFQNLFDYKRIIFYDKDSIPFKIGERFGFKAVRTFGIGNPTLDYEWTGGNLFYGGQRGYIPDGTGTIPSGLGGGFYLIYIDGTRDANGYFELKKLYSASNTLGWIPSLPEGVKVLAMFVILGDDILKIYGQSFVGSYASIPASYSGPFHVGPSFVTSNARTMTAGFRGSRFMVYFASIFGSGFMADPEYAQKRDMIEKILRAVKPAKTMIVFGASPIVSNMTEI